MARPEDEPSPKPVRWVGSSRDDLRAFPEEVRNRVGGALWEAQLGRKAPYAKPLKMLKNPLLPRLLKRAGFRRLLKRVQMQGGARRAE